MYTIKKAASLSGTVCISDPCYFQSDHYDLALYFDKVNIFVCLDDDPEGRPHIGFILSPLDSIPPEARFTDPCGDIGVDSGSIAVVQAQYLPKWFDSEPAYECCGRLILSEAGYGFCEEFQTFVTSTERGDGVYQVYQGGAGVLVDMRAFVAERGGWPYDQRVLDPS